MSPFSGLTVAILTVTIQLVAGDARESGMVLGVRNFTNIQVIPGIGDMNLPLVQGTEACNDTVLLADFEGFRYGGCSTNIVECIYIPDNNVYPVNLVIKPKEVVTLKSGTVYFFMEGQPDPISYTDNAPPNTPALEPNEFYTLAADFKPDVILPGTTIVYFKFWLIDVLDRPVMCVNGHIKVLNNSYGSR